jgi:hypothetical protein
MPAALFLVLAGGALGASMALLMARLGFFLAADALAIGAALLGLAAFVIVAWSTTQHARGLPSRGDRR